MDIEIDEVAVEKELWIKILKGDKDSIIYLRNKLNGVYLYEHILSSYFNSPTHPSEEPDKYIKVNIKQLQQNDVIGFVKIENDDWNFVNN